MCAVPQVLHARRCRQWLLFSMLDIFLLDMRLLGSGPGESKRSRAVAVLIMLTSCA